MLLYMGRLAFFMQKREKRHLRKLALKKYFCIWIGKNLCHNMRFARLSIWRISMCFPVKLFRQRQFAVFCWISLPQKKQYVHLCWIYKGLWRIMPFCWKRCFALTKHMRLSGNAWNRGLSGAFAKRIICYMCMAVIYCKWIKRTKRFLKSRLGKLKK